MHQHGGVEITPLLPMPARRIVANAGVKDDVGKTALQRGPLVYAVEAIDNGGGSPPASTPVTVPTTGSDYSGWNWEQTLVGVLGLTLPDRNEVTNQRWTAINFNSGGGSGLLVDLGFALGGWLLEQRFTTAGNCFPQNSLSDFTIPSSVK